jgi:hypothetical protein
MSNGDSTSSFMDNVANMNAGLNGLVLGNFLINLLLSSSLNSLWTMINTLQMTLHLPAMNLRIPPNASFFSSMLINIA